MCISLFLVFWEKSAAAQILFYAHLFQTLQDNLFLNDILYVWIKPADKCDWELTPNIISKIQK